MSSVIKMAIGTKKAETTKNPETTKDDAGKDSGNAKKFKSTQVDLNFFEEFTKEAPKKELRLHVTMACGSGKKAREGQELKVSDIISAPHFFATGSNGHTVNVTVSCPKGKCPDAVRGESGVLVVQVASTIDGKVICETDADGNVRLHGDFVSFNGKKSVDSIVVNPFEQLNWAQADAISQAGKAETAKRVLEGIDMAKKAVEAMKANG